MTITKLQCSTQNCRFHISKWLIVYHIRPFFNYSYVGVTFGAAYKYASEPYGHSKDIRNVSNSYNYTDGKHNNLGERCMVLYSLNKATTTSCEMLH